MTSDTFSAEAENCLIIVLDTVRARSTYVGGEETTPNLERLAAEGTSFNRAIASAPWTLPSHASMYTGLFPTEHGATHQQKWLDSSHTTLPQRVNEEGVRTGLFTANMFLTESFNMAKGFDKVSFVRGEDNKLFNDGLDPVRFINERKHDEGIKRFREIAEAVLDGPIGKNAVNALYYKLQHAYRQRKGTMEPRSWDEQSLADLQKFISNAASGNRRFFAVVNLIGAHGPWEFDRDRLKAIGVTPESVAPAERWKEVATNSAAQWPYAASEIAFDTTDRQILTHLYESWVYRVDELAGEVIDHLESERVRDDTLVMVTADHGECIARDEVLGHELTVDESVAHVPLAVTGPGIPTESVSDPVSLKDIYGTVLTAMGIADKQHLWDDASRGCAFIENYPVDLDTISKQYRNTAKSFGRRYALFETGGWAERREQPNESYGDAETLNALDEFISGLETFDTTDANHGHELPSEVKTRLQELGYRS